ncbi:MAG: cytochrome [Acidobacteria bacterium]|jgi:cytochrome c oxidase cbb3-type subunit 3|nr:cytochrome [Acidobacteriota bacterium]
MTEFTSDFWPWFIGIVSILSLAACFLFLVWVGRGRPPQQVETLDHGWDGDLRELNNPLPGWWRWLFYGSLVFAVAYLVLYPGLGFFPGTRGWSQEEQYRAEVEQAEGRYGPLFERFAAMDIPTLARDAEARKVGERLFLTYCTACHGSDAGGAIGYPNLRDEEWQWGGTPEAIVESITNGRVGVMAAWQEALGDDGVREVAQYVLSFSGRATREDLLAAGKEKYEMACFTCHKNDGKGNQALGSLNHTDDIWRWGGSEQAVETSIAKGRRGVMPAHGQFLGSAKVHLLAAYVYGLSKQP